MSKTRSNRKKKRAYTRKHYQSNDGMLTSVWGPSAWHFLHTLSFNYPVNPTCDDKRNYREYVLSLRHVLPCGKCRKNLCKNFNKHPLLYKHMQNRTTFSKYIYKLHEVVNEMLGKKSGLSYEDVRDRYEHFRSRCTQNDAPKIFKFDTSASQNKEKGCTEPLYGEKARCVIQIVPQQNKTPSFVVDDKCIKVKVGRT